MNEEFLQKVLSDIEEKALRDVESGNDKGHSALVEDVKSFYQDVCSLQFHDLLNTDYAAPKMALMEKLEMIKSNLMEGKYDN